jgi:hypothetical protein
LQRIASQLIGTTMHAAEYALSSQHLAAVARISAIRYLDDQSNAEQTAVGLAE